MLPDVRRDGLFPSLGAVLLFAGLVTTGLLYQTIAGGASDKLVTSMLIDAIVVIGLQVYIGNTGVLSFGHIGFGAIAGYTFAVLAIDPARKTTVIRNAPFGLNEIELSPGLATVVAVIVTLAVAVVVGLGLARSGARSGAVAATVITMALLFVTHELAVNWTDLTGGDRAGLSFSIGDTLSSRWPILVALLVAFGVARVFASSRTGRLAQATREDNLAARAMGIDPQVAQFIALMLSVALVAVAASLRVYEIGNITPKFFFFDYTLLTLVMLIVGGRNSTTGAAIGVVVITAARELARRLGTDGYSLFGVDLDAQPLDLVFREGLPTVVLGLCMLIFMIRRPEGLVGDWELDKWLYRRATVASETEPEPSPTRPSPKPVDFEASDLTVDFGGFRALNGVSASLDTAEIVGLIGPNGAGKTTMVNVITGIVPPSSGSFGLNGADLTGKQSFEIARAGMVRTFQNLRLFGALTVRENVEAARLEAEHHRDPADLPDIDALLVEVGLWPQRHRRASELDYGNSRRLELARAAATGPSVMLLDEPTSGMSDVESLAMVERVRRMAAVVGASVLVIDHDLAFITGIADRIYCLDQGALLATGTPAEIQANPAVQAAYLGSAAPA